MNPAPAPLQSEDLAALYPFLIADAGAPADGAREDELARSARAKYQESIELRRRVLRGHGTALIDCATAIARALGRGASVYSFGNGGSQTDAAAFTTRLDGAPVSHRRRACVTLTGRIAIVSALANDIGYERAIARLLDTYARFGDFAVAFTTSGNSANVVAGLATARRIGMSTIAFSGYDGGLVAEPGLVDHLFVVPSPSVHRIQEAHTALIDVLARLVAVAGESEEVLW
jgi:D-sedoheptulose 7-phosphate isomerase